jgi:hypothetical protein
VTKFTSDQGRKIPIVFGRERKKELLTSGALPTGRESVVYVGQAPDGRVKIGMTTNPVIRGYQLNVEIRYVMPVRSETARELETLALQHLGHEQGDKEWLRHPDVDAAVNAIRISMDALRKRLWMDPHLTEAEARRLRVRMAMDDEAIQQTVATPDQPFQKKTVTSYRRVISFSKTAPRKYL